MASGDVIRSYPSRLKINIIIFCPCFHPLRFYSYRLFTVHCETGPLLHIPVHRFPRQIISLLVRTSLEIGTSLLWVSVISHHVLKNRLPSSMFHLVAVLIPYASIHTLSHARYDIVCVQIGSGFDSSMDPYYVLCLVSFLSISIPCCK